jgi:hypothetical protein
LSGLFYPADLVFVNHQTLSLDNIIHVLYAVLENCWLLLVSIATRLLNRREYHSEAEHDRAGF